MGPTCPTSVPAGRPTGRPAAYPRGPQARRGAYHRAAGRPTGGREIRAPAGADPPVDLVLDPPVDLVLDPPVDLRGGADYQHFSA
jgi:hypothetical protein